jgi:hypothetical protein
VTSVLLIILIIYLPIPYFSIKFSFRVPVHRTSIRPLNKRCNHGSGLCGFYTSHFLICLAITSFPRGLCCMGLLCVVMYANAVDQNLKQFDTGSENIVVTHFCWLISCLAFGSWLLESGQFHCHMWNRGSGNKISVVNRSEALLPVLNKIFSNYRMTDMHMCRTNNMKSRK